MYSRPRQRSYGCAAGTHSDSEVLAVYVCFSSGQRIVSDNGPNELIADILEAKKLCISSTMR
jgi:hypothetical protein